VFCKVKSHLTGQRLVSLPFTDHCDPLCDNDDTLCEMLSCLAAEREQLGVRHIEIRPLQEAWNEADRHSPFRLVASYRFHVLDLTPTMETIFRRFDKDCVQRRIRRSEREGLTYEEGGDGTLLRKFYRLLVTTRKRHGVPPQPFMWFQNLTDLLRERVTIRVVSKADMPIAAILTLASRSSVIYKYGGSDLRFNNLAGTAQLLWRAIRDAKTQGARAFDMGRSDPSNRGLIRFKSNWAAEERLLTYWRFPATEPRTSAVWGQIERIGHRALAHLPERLCIAAGRVFYKHAG
jgi:hypothetical protein